jgi:hypothetical protein
VPIPSCRVCSNVSVTDEPRRFEIRFWDIDGRGCSHRIVTYMGEKKAVAMAAVNHQYWHEELGIYTVEVTGAEAVETDEHGVCRLDDDDVTDRMEW